MAGPRRSRRGPMDRRAGTCPLSQRQVIEEYFIENRTKILDIAAFLDRLDRASERDVEVDFRLTAFRQALQAPFGEESSRLQAVQMGFSDPTVGLLPSHDRKRR